VSGVDVAEPDNDSDVSEMRSTDLHFRDDILLDSVSASLSIDTHKLLTDRSNTSSKYGDSTRK